MVEIAGNSDALHRYVTQLEDLTAVYHNRPKRTPEVLARRVFVTGLRAATLEFAAAVTGRAPCRSYRFTVGLAHRLSDAARARLEADHARRRQAELEGTP